jgi:alpha-pyrone synthase
MHLSGTVPQRIGRHLPAHVADLLGQKRVSDVDFWAVHPGGRSILDAVQDSLELGAGALAESREVLRRFGNMSSATVMFVLRALLERAPRPDQGGVALGFGPGLAVESFTFRGAG